MKQHKQRLEG